MGMVGSIIGAFFGVFWTVMAAQSGAPGIFVAFGVVFILLAVAGGIYNLVNATGQNRFSEFDIVQSSAEPDPFAPRRAHPSDPATTANLEALADGRFCPFCGAALSAEFNYCPKCGKAIPG